jgi:hypothetical protein
MARIHAFEFEDLGWFPALLRRQMTDYLAHLQRVLPGLPRYVASRIGAALEAMGSQEVVDLGSGSGGVMPEVARVLEEDLGLKPRVLLTDRYPDVEVLAALRDASAGRLDFHPEPVDATAVPSEVRGLRTMILSFHHFRPSEARAILADAVRARTGIAIFEATNRRLAAVLPAIPGIPIMVLLVTPFIRPFRWSRLLFTYLLPVLPLLILWDGIVSQLRTYSPAELRELVSELDAPDWEWDVRRERPRGTPAPVISLVGVRRKAGQLPTAADSTSPP